MSEIRILSLWQPWATLIAVGLKRYETRSWGTDYRGKLAIHAAKRPFINSDGDNVLDKGAYSLWLRTLEVAYDQGILRDQSRVPFSHQLPLGRIVAIVDLTDCRKMQRLTPGYPPSPGFDPRNGWLISIDHQTPLEQTVGDWRVNRHAWRFENIRPIAHPIPYRGAQGLRVIRDEAVLAAIAEQMGLTDSIEQQLQAMNADAQADATEGGAV